MSMILDDVLATAATLRKQEAAEPRSVGSVDVEPESISEQQPDRPVETVAAPTPTQSTEPAPAVPTSSRRRRPFDPGRAVPALPVDQHHQSSQVLPISGGRHRSLSRRATVARHCWGYSPV